MSIAAEIGARRMHPRSQARTSRIGGTPVGDLLIVEEWERLDGHLVDFVREATNPGLRRQRIEAAITRNTRPWVLLLEAGTHAVFSGQPGNAPLEELCVEIPATRTSVTGFRTPASSVQTIRPDAKFLAKLVSNPSWRIATLTGDPL